MSEPVVATAMRGFGVSAERVFDAWVTPTDVERFLFATLTGKMVHVEVHARVGGGFVVTERRDGEDVEHIGTYEALDRPTRIVFQFKVPKYSNESARVEIEIERRGVGCELVLTHELAPAWADQKEKMEQGWATVLAGLAKVVEP